ncbi:MAG: MFS transporter [Deltaproteobacteria bacterium]|nr:MFS transporter [Deltaproteobacteria bacterium]
MKTKFFYGWVVVGVSFISMAFWMGIRSSFSVFYAKLVDELGWARADIALAQSLTFIMYMVVVPFVGTLIDRFGPRRVVIPGILLTGIGLALCATIKDVLEIYLFYGLIVGIGTPFISIVSYSSVLAHWFQKRRGLASGIATSGMGIGTFGLVILSQILIASYGWRMAFLILGFLTICLLIPANGLLLRHKPEEIGLTTDGQTKVYSENSQVTTGQKVGGILKNRNFWMCIAFASLALLAVHIILVHNVRILMDQGLSMSKAASGLAMVGLVSSVFRIFWGWLSDKIGRKMSYTLGAFFLISSTIFLFTTTAHQEWFIHFFVFCFSAGWAVTAPSFMALLADLFKGEKFGTIYGLFESTIYGLSVLGVWLVGLIYDFKGVYWPHTFIILVTSIAGSIFVIWLIELPRKNAVFSE